MNTEEKRNDEIDLVEVFFNIYRFLKKHFWVLFLSGMIGGAIGYSTKFLASKHFESTMLIESYTLENDILIEYINNIQTIIKDQNHSYLSDKLGLNDDDVINLKEINAIKLFNEKNKKELDYIKVVVKSDNNELYHELSDNLQLYLTKEIYITDEIELFKEQNQSLIENINSEILLLEELQRKNIKSSTNNKSGVNIYNDQNSFHKDLLGLIKEKQKLQKKLNYAAPFRVIEDFIIYQTPIKKTVTYTLTGGFTLGFIVLFYLILRLINRKIKEQE